jgi:cold shock CspA family protein
MLFLSLSIKAFPREDTIMERGRVDAFDTSKMHGFIIPQSGDGEPVFFHYEAARQFYSGGVAVEWNLVLGRPHGASYPKSGDLVVFERQSTLKSPKAEPWGFHSWFTTAERMCMRQNVPQALWPIWAGLREMLYHSNAYMDTYAEFARQLGSMTSILLSGGVDRSYLEQLIAGVQPEERFTQAPIPLAS